MPRQIFYVTYRRSAAIEASQCQPLLRVHQIKRHCRASGEDALESITCSLIGKLITKDILSRVFSSQELAPKEKFLCKFFNLNPDTTVEYKSYGEFWSNS